MLVPLGLVGSDLGFGWWASWAVHDKCRGLFASPTLSLHSAWSLDSWCFNVHVLSAVLQSTAWSIAIDISIAVRTCTSKTYLSPDSSIPFSQKNWLSTGTIDHFYFFFVYYYLFHRPLFITCSCAVIETGLKPVLFSFRISVVVKHIFILHFFEPFLFTRILMSGERTFINRRFSCRCRMDLS